MHIRLPLPAALRHRVESEEYLWAYLASLLLSPPVVWAIWVFAIAWTANAERHLNLRFALLFACAVCAAPILFVTFMVRNGRISDLHMRESRERYIPYSIAIIGGLLCAIIFWRYDADPVLFLLTLVTISNWRSCWSARSSFISASTPPAWPASSRPQRSYLALAKGCCSCRCFC